MGGHLSMSQMAISHLRHRSFGPMQHSTSGDRPSNPSNESQPKCDKRPPKSSKDEILIFILRSTSDDQPSDLSDDS